MRLFGDIVVANHLISAFFLGTIESLVGTFDEDVFGEIGGMDITGYTNACRYVEISPG